MFKCAICVQLLFNEPSFPSLLSVSQHSASLHCDAFGNIFCLFHSYILHILEIP